uniref:Putative structural protein n=1 Tax=viral metagenome TaxID=1070528 RepID=A0A6M3K3F1_9ZZZZ
MRIKQSIFKGERPLTAKTLLPEQEAITATNCKLERGYLAPWKAPKKTYAIPDQGTFNSLYRYEEPGGKHWIWSAKKLDFVGSPIVDDPHWRDYMTGDGPPRVYCRELVSDPFNFDTDFYLLGVPAPEFAPVIDSGYTGGLLYRAYAYSYVVVLNNIDAEEGPPSDVVSITDYGSGDVTLSGFTAPPASRQIGKIRIYRTNLSTSGIVAFQYVGEFETAGVDFSAYTFTDNVSDANLQPDFPYPTSYTPPPENMKGLTSLFNGSFAGFYGNTVYISEPYLPHAWPHSYPVEDNIIALGWFGTTLVVLTDESPYLMYGPPESMEVAKLPTKMPCISEWSISSENGVIFSSNEGLGMVDQNGATIITANIITETQWKDSYYPKTMKLVYFESKIFGFHVAGSFVFDVNSGIFASMDILASALFVERGTGNFYYITDDADKEAYNAIYQFEGDPNDYLQYTWKSKRFMLPYYCVFTAARVITALDEYTEIAALIASNAANLAENEAMLIPKTWNPDDKDTDITLSDSNKTAKNTTFGVGHGYSSVRGEFGIDTTGDPVYFEVHVITRGSTTETTTVGIANSSMPLSALKCGATADSWGYLASGAKYHSNVSTSPFGDTYTSNDIIGIYIDGAKVWFSKNGTWQGVTLQTDPENGLNPAYSDLSGTIYPFLTLYGDAASPESVLKFLTADLTYTPPTGTRTMKNVGGDINDDPLLDLPVLGDNLNEVLDLDVTSAITFNVYGDGSLVHTESVSGNNPFRLTPANLYKRMEYEIIGYVPISEIVLATSMGELET